MDRLMYLFFAAWLLCGCSIDTALDDPKAGIVALIAMIVAVGCSIALGRRD